MHRRRLLHSGLGALGALALAGPSRLVLAQAAAQSCPPPTEPDIEGPFYRAGAPAWTGPALGAAGALLSISCSVRDTSCRPMRGATIEVWQADADGEYDLTGNRFRGVLRTTADGYFNFSTIVPGRYLNGARYRPAHIHVKVHANGRPTLTTQLYFPGDPENDTDPWFRSSLLLSQAPSPCCYVPNAPTQMHFGFIV